MWLRIWKWIVVNRLLNKLLVVENIDRETLMLFWSFWTETTKVVMISKYFWKTFGEQILLAFKKMYIFLLKNNKSSSFMKVYNLWKQFKQQKKNFFSPRFINFYKCFLSFLFLFQKSFFYWSKIKNVSNTFSIFFFWVVF